MPFTKPSQRPAKPTKEPPGLDEFARGATNVHLLEPTPPKSSTAELAASGPAVVQRSAPPAAVPPSSPAGLDPKAKPTHGRNVRFNDFTRSVLAILGERDDRSIQYYVNQLFIPAVIELAKKEGLYQADPSKSDQSDRG